MRFLLPLMLAGVLAQQPETLSLLEEPLYAPPVPRAERARLESEIAEARAAVLREPANAGPALKLARAQRGLGHVGDALETLTRAIERKADTPAVRLERGRGFIVIRKFDLAQREIRKAVETIPGAHCDLGLALYLLEDYKGSHEEFGRCPQPGVFGYLSARRAGENAGPRPEPPADDRSTSGEVRLPGSTLKQAPSQASTMAGGYMDAVERLLANQKPAAKDLLKPIVEKQKTAWMEPVYIAAENDYAKILKTEPKKRKKKK